MTKIEIIQDTVDYYAADPFNRRSVTAGGNTCMYKGPHGKECAFQRCVVDDLSGSEGSGLGVFDLTSLTFKPGYEGHDVMFWKDIQTLHDDRLNWNIGGLSASGEAYVRMLKRKWDGV